MGNTTANLTAQSVDVVQAIRAWLDARTNASKVNDIVGYFGESKSFIITRDFFNLWNNEGVQFVHAYPSIIDDQLNFILVDDLTDQNILENGVISEADQAKIMVAPFSFELTDQVMEKLERDKDGNISKEKALGRMNKWKNEKSAWIPNALSESRADSSTGMFKLFSIPFNDLVTNFANEEAQVETVLIMGIEDSEQYGETADILVWGYDMSASDAEQVMMTGSTDESVDDSTVVCPPLCNGTIGGGDGLMSLAQ